MVSAENSSLEYLRSLSKVFKNNMLLIKFIFFIVNYDVNSILYDDTLICSLTNNTNVGSFEVKVTKTNYGNLHDCLQVVANRFGYDVFINK